MISKVKPFYFLLFTDYTVRRTFEKDIMEPLPYKKLIVVGTTSSGKSTLAERLANELGLEFIELDALNWGPNWTAAGDELLRERVDQATRSPELGGGRQLPRDPTGYLGSCRSGHLVGLLALGDLLAALPAYLEAGILQRRSYGTVTANIYGYN